MHVSVMNEDEAEVESAELPHESTEANRTFRDLYYERDCNVTKLLPAFIL